MKPTKQKSKEAEQAALLTQKALQCPLNEIRFFIGISYVIYGFWAFFTLTNLELLYRLICLSLFGLGGLVCMPCKKLEGFSALFTFFMLGTLALSLVPLWITEAYNYAVLFLITLPVWFTSYFMLFPSELGIRLSSPTKKVRWHSVTFIFICPVTCFIFILMEGITLNGRLFPENWLAPFSSPNVLFGVAVMCIFQGIFSEMMLKLPNSNVPRGKSLLSALSATLALLALIMPAFPILYISTTVFEETYTNWVSSIDFIQLLFEQSFDFQQFMSSSSEKAIGFPNEDFGTLLLVMTLCSIPLVITGILSIVGAKREANGGRSGTIFAVFSGIVLLSYTILSLVPLFQLNELGISKLGITILSPSAIFGSLGVAVCIAYLIVDQPSIQEKLNRIKITSAASKSTVPPSEKPVADSSLDTRSANSAPVTQSFSTHSERAASESETITLLTQYKELLDKGIITEEEFEEKKKELLKKE